MLPEHPTRDLSIEIALLLERWQGIVNLMAQLSEVPCVLINRLNKSDICIEVTGSTTKSHFQSGDRIPLQLNSYCSVVISSRKPLLVEDAVGTKYEHNNPTLAAGFSYYYGVPLLWPDGQVFGTLCMLDRASAHRASQHRSLLTLFKQAIEYDLNLLEQQQMFLKREQQTDDKFVELFSQVCQALKPTPKSTLLQSELFVLLTSQYQYWHHALELQLNQTTLHTENSLHIAAIVRIWSNLLAIAHEIERLPMPLVAGTTPVSSINTFADATPLLEQAVYKTALTLGSELVLRSHLPNPLSLPGRPELWSLIGLAVTSFLVIGASGSSKTIFISTRLQDGSRVLEWSLLIKDQTMPLCFNHDNEPLYGFAAVCAELAGARLESSEHTLCAALGEDRLIKPHKTFHSERDTAVGNKAGVGRFIRLWLPS